MDLGVCLCVGRGAYINHHYLFLIMVPYCVLSKYWCFRNTYNVNVVSKCQKLSVTNVVLLKFVRNNKLCCACCRMVELYDPVSLGGLHCGGSPASSVLHGSV